MSFVCPALPGFFVGWRGAFAREGLVLRRAFGAIEHAFKMNGRVPKLARCQGVWAHDGV